MRVQPGKLLAVYSAVLTAAFAFSLVSNATARQDKVAFGEIDVERINVREKDGTLRWVVSNTSRHPGVIVKGKEQPHPNRVQAGMLFFNEAGTETGGMTWGGREVDGKPRSNGSLTFDRYEQDQVVQILQKEDDHGRTSGLLVYDRPDARMNFAAIEEWRVAKTGPEKQAAIAKANLGEAQRVFVGRQTDDAAEIKLGDGQGRPRLVFRVEKDGAASIRFLDEKGAVVRTVTPEQLAAAAT